MDFDPEGIMQKQGRRRGQRGINLISVVVATVIMSVAGLAVLAALNTTFKASRTAEPKAVGQASVANFQTDLNAMAMYDPSVLSSIRSGAHTSITHPAAPSGTSYMPADTQPTVITVQQATTTGNSGQIIVNYQVPADSSGTAAVSGNATVTVTQKGTTGCDPNLVGKPGTGC